MALVERCAGGLAMLATLCACAGRHPTQRELVEFRSTATFAFSAVIDSLRASTSPNIPSGPHTIAATVHNGLRCPAEVGRYDGLPITVYVDDPKGLKPGDTWWFLAGAWSVGSHLAVHEIARYRGAFADTAIGQRFLGVTTPAALFADRTSTAFEIVTGSMALDTQRVLNDVFRDFPGVWIPVRVTVTGTLKGQLQAGDTITVAMPVTGLSWPALSGRPGVPLVLLLNATRDVPQDLVHGVTKPMFMLQDALSVQPASDSAAVATLLRIQGDASGSRVQWLPRCGGLFPRGN